jgi:hypothetical protein
MAAVGLLVTGLLLWAVSFVIGYFEERAKDREFWDRWHEERRPGKGSGY